MNDRMQDVERMAKDLAFATLTDKGRAECEWPQDFGAAERRRYEAVAMYLVAKGWSKP